jgi:hypothetical protein
MAQAMKGDIHVLPQSTGAAFEITLPIHEEV